MWCLAAVGLLLLAAGCGGRTEPGPGNGSCGNGVIEEGETCDWVWGPTVLTMDFGGASCATLGFDDGQLRCDDCQIATRDCWRCGDGVTRMPYEECDGDDPGWLDCVQLGFLGGTLGCTADCTADTSACEAGFCGDGLVSSAAGEICDGADWIDDCTTWGITLGGGYVLCNADCTLDTSNCDTNPCGDGFATGPEECDAPDLNDFSCQSFGFTAGFLTCTPECEFDTSGCQS